MIIPSRLILATGIHTLGVGARSHGARNAILNRNGLQRGRCAQSDGLLVLQALVGRGAAINGVEDARARRTRHTYLSSLSELRLTTEGRSRYGLRLLTTTGTALLTARARSTRASALTTAATSGGAASSAAARTFVTVAGA